MPPSKPITIDMGKGRVHSITYAGDLCVNIGAGQIIVDTSTKSLNIDGGSLEGTFKNMSGMNKFHYGKGALNFIWDMLPATSAHLLFSIGSGSAHLLAPANASISTKGVDGTPGFMGLGGFSVKSEFSETEQVPNITVSGSGGSGKITVEKKV